MGRLSLFPRRECAPDEIRESRFGAVAVLFLTSHLARNDPKGTIVRYARRKTLFDYPLLLIRQYARIADIPVDLDPRRGLVDMLATSTGRSRRFDVQLSIRNNNRVCDGN